MQNHENQKNELIFLCLKFSYLPFSGHCFSPTYVYYQYTKKCKGKETLDFWFPHWRFFPWRNLPLKELNLFSSMYGIKLKSIAVFALALQILRIMIFLISANTDDHDDFNKGITKRNYFVDHLHCMRWRYKVLNSQEILSKCWMS